MVGRERRPWWSDSVTMTRRRTGAVRRVAAFHTRPDIVPAPRPRGLEVAQGGVEVAERVVGVEVDTVRVLAEQAGKH